MRRTGLIGIVPLLVLAMVSCRPPDAALGSQVVTPGPANLAGLAASISVDAGQQLGPVNRTLFGSYVLSAGGGNGLLDAEGAFDPEAMTLAQDLQPGLLRMADKPIWEDAVGPQRSRLAPRCGEPSWQTNGYGLDEHMALLERVGAPGQALLFVGYPYALANSADPRSCVVLNRPGSLDQMVKRAMAMVAYANATPANTTVIGVDGDGFDWGTAGSWALRRQRNGHAAPYNVRFWEIGNELYYRTDPPISPQQYADDYMAFRSAMKRVDPTIKVGVGARIEAAADARWNIPLLAALQGNLDALVLHMYYPDAPDNANLNPVLMAASTAADNDLARLRQLIATYAPQPEQVSIFLGENGVLFSSPEDATTWNRQVVGVYDADMIGLYVRRSSSYRLDLAVQHWLHGASPTADIAFDWTTTRRYPRPDYYALQIWATHFGDTLVDVTTRSPTFDLPAGAGNVANAVGIPYLAAHASTRGECLYLMVINRSLSDAIAAQIQLQGFTPAAKAWTYMLHGPGPNATNETGNHDSVKITSAILGDASTSFDFVFSAQSVTALVLSRAGAVCPSSKLAQHLPLLIR